MYDALRAELGAEYDVVAPLMGLAPADEVLARSNRARSWRAPRRQRRPAVATAAPERVAGLALFAASLLDADEPSAELRSYWADEERLIEAGDVDAAVALSVATWVRDPAIADLAAAMFRDGYAHEARLEAAGEYVERPVDLAVISAPTVAVDGGLDFPAFAGAADRIAAHVAGARRETVARRRPPDPARAPARGGGRHRSLSPGPAPG